MNMDRFREDKSCALCNKYFDYSYREGNNCLACPIVKSGNVACVNAGSAYTDSSQAEASPTPMLKVLRQALKYCEKHPEEFE